MWLPRDAGVTAGRATKQRSTLDDTCTSSMAHTWHLTCSVPAAVKRAEARSVCALSRAVVTLLHAKYLKCPTKCCKSSQLCASHVHVRGTAHVMVGRIALSCSSAIACDVRCRKWHVAAIKRRHVSTARCAWVGKFITATIPATRTPTRTCQNSKMGAASPPRMF